MDVRWFGGATGLLGTVRRPAAARLLTTYPATWLVGDWPSSHVRTQRRPNGTLVVFGACSATARELERLPADLPDRAATTWSGAYTVVFADRDGSVTILTDPACACPIYTARADNNGIVWASSSRALAGLIGAGVDDSWLAANLALPGGTFSVGSAWAGVELVPPGHRLRIMAGRQPTVQTAWRPPTADRRWSPDRIRDALDAAIACRITGNPSSADLSGGLDSTTLAVLSARRQPVTAVTVRPESVDRGGDLDYARLTAATIEGLRHLELALSDEQLPYTDVTSIPATDEPAPSSPTWRRLSAELAALRAAGATCHLTGDGGDTLFAAPPVYLADLVRAGRLIQLARDAQGWARLRHASPWPGASAALRGDVAALTARAQSPMLTQEARERASTLCREEREPGLGDADRFLLDDIRHTARTAHAEAQLADTFGITMENPYLDARLLDLVLATPVHRRASPRRYKPLLSDAAAGIVPDGVRLRGTKGTFAADHHRGLRKNLRQLLALTDGELAQRRLIRPIWLTRQLHRAALGLDVPWSQIAPVIAAEVWLRSVQRDAPPAWVSGDSTEETA